MFARLHVGPNWSWNSENGTWKFLKRRGKGTAKHLFCDQKDRFFPALARLDYESGPLSPVQLRLFPLVVVLGHRS